MDYGIISLSPNRNIFRLSQSNHKNQLSIFISFLENVQLNGVHSNGHQKWNQTIVTSHKPLNIAINFQVKKKGSQKTSSSRAAMKGNRKCPAAKWLTLFILVKVCEFWVVSATECYWWRVLLVDESRAGGPVCFRRPSRHRRLHSNFVLCLFLSYECCNLFQRISPDDRSISEQNLHCCRCFSFTSVSVCVSMPLIFWLFVCKRLTTWIF